MICCHAAGCRGPPHREFSCRSDGRDPGRPYPGRIPRLRAGNYRKDSLDQSIPATQGKYSGLRATYVRINQAADGSRRHVPVLRTRGGKVSTARGTWHPRSQRARCACGGSARTACGAGGHRRTPGRPTSSAGRRPLPCRPPFSGRTNAARTGNRPARCASCSADRR